MGQETEQTNAERIQFLLSSLEMEFVNLERGIGAIDYQNAYQAFAELRELIALEIGN